MSDTARISVEIFDEHTGTGGTDERRVTIEVTLPTGEGSEGPNLESPEGLDDLATLVQRVSSAAYACLRDGRTPAVDEELRVLDKTVDAAHQRLDAIGAPDIMALDARRRQDEELLRRHEELSVKERVASERERQRAQASIVQDRPDA